MNDPCLNALEGWWQAVLGTVEMLIFRDPTPLEPRSYIVTPWEMSGIFPDGALYQTLEFTDGLQGEVLMAMEASHALTLAQASRAEQCAGAGGGHGGVVQLEAVDVRANVGVRGVAVDGE